MLSSGKAFCDCIIETSAHFIAEELLDVEGDMKSNSSNFNVLKTQYEETEQNPYDRMFQESLHVLNMQKSWASVASHQLPHSASLPGQVDSHQQCNARQTSSSVLIKNGTFKTIDMEYPEVSCTSEFNKLQAEASNPAAVSVTMVYESASEAQEGPDVIIAANNTDEPGAKRLAEVGATTSTSITDASATPFDEMRQCYSRIFNLHDTTDNQKVRQAGDLEVRNNASCTKVQMPPYEDMKQNIYHHMFRESAHYLNTQKSRVTLASLEIDTESTDVSIPVASEDSLQRLVAEDSTIIAVDIDGNVIRADDESATSEAVSVEALIEDLQNMMAKPSEKRKEITSEDTGEDASRNDTPLADDSSVNESEAPANENTDVDHVESTYDRSAEKADPEQDMIRAEKFASHSSVPVSEAEATPVNAPDAPADGTDASVNNANATEVASTVNSPLAKAASPPKAIMSNANTNDVAPAVGGSSIKKASPVKVEMKAAKSAITAKVPTGDSRGESKSSSFFQFH